MDISLLENANWELLNADGKLLAAKKKISFVQALKEIAKERPDRIINQDLFDRILELIKKNDSLSVMSALELIQEEEKISLTHSIGEDDVQKYDRSSIDSRLKAEKLTRERGISYVEALKEVSPGERTEEYSLSDKEKGEKDEKERTERNKLEGEVRIYQANNPADRRNFTELFKWFLDLKERGISLVKK